MKLAAAFLFVVATNATLPIPAPWIAVDPRVKALLPHGTVLRSTERIRWGAIVVHDYELSVKLDKVDLELERLTDIARASELIPTFYPHGGMRMNGPGIFIDIRASQATGTIDVRYSLDGKPAVLKDELARYPRCETVDALSGSPRTLEYTRTVDVGDTLALTVHAGKADRTASCRVP